MSNKSIVIGCGGHSRAILNILIQEMNADVMGIYDINTPKINETILGIPISGSVDDLLKKPVDKSISIYLAIGKNDLRQKWFKRFTELGYKLDTLISNKAIMSLGVKLGVGSLISPLTFIGPLSTIGDNTIINTSALIEHESKIGNACHLAPGSRIMGRSKIGNNVFIGSGATIINKLSICDGVIIGAGAVVVESITNQGTYVGVPAKRLNN